MFIQEQNVGKTQGNRTPDTEEICCPLFEPQKWDNVKHMWNGKPFLMATVPEIFHIPLPGTYAEAIERMWKQAQAGGVAQNQSRTKG